MTLEQLANLADIIGGILVIASLVYVGRQLQQNTDMMRANHANDFVAHTGTLISPITHDREFADLWIGAESGFEQLDSIDKQRIVLFEWQALQAWHNWFNLHQRNLVSDYQWNELKWGMEHFGKRPSVREAWRVFRDSYTPEFREFMAQFLEQGTESLRLR